MQETFIIGGGSKFKVGGGGEPLVLLESGGAQCKNLKKWGGGAWPLWPPVSSAYVYSRVNTAYSTVFIPLR